MRVYTDLGLLRVIPYVLFVVMVIFLESFSGNVPSKGRPRPPYIAWRIKVYKLVYT